MKTLKTLLQDTLVVQEKTRGSISALLKKPETDNNETDPIKSVLNFSIDSLADKRLKILLTELAWKRTPICIRVVRQPKRTYLRNVLYAPFRALSMALSTSGFSVMIFFFTWVIPVVPIAATYQMLMQNYRRRTAAELLEIVQHIYVPGYSYQLKDSCLYGHAHSGHSIGENRRHVAA